MAAWKSPIYKYRNGRLVIDVTSSISAGLDPHRVVRKRFMKIVKKSRKRRVLDFGAGALRHTIPMLRYKDVQVCAVEFEEAFMKPVAQETLERVSDNPNFSRLIWPKQFKRDRRRFDAALLAFVLQIMPEEKERETVLKLISKKLVDGGYLLYMARARQITNEMRERPLNDGYYMYPERKHHSFYTEFNNEDTDELMAKFKLIREKKTWSEGGSEQVFLYRKMTGQWG